MPHIVLSAKLHAHHKTSRMHHRHRACHARRWQRLVRCWWWFPLRRWSVLSTPKHRITMERSVLCTAVHHHRCSMRALFAMLRYTPMPACHPMPRAPPPMLAVFAQPNDCDYDDSAMRPGGPIRSTAPRPNRNETRCVCNRHDTDCRHYRLGKRFLRSSVNAHQGFASPPFMKSTTARKVSSTQGSCRVLVRTQRR
jgi:hypothetical protein